jgi:hypothetical protein
MARGKPQWDEFDSEDPYFTHAVECGLPALGERQHEFTCETGSAELQEDPCPLVGQVNEVHRLPGCLPLGALPPCAPRRREAAARGAGREEDRCGRCW